MLIENQKRNIMQRHSDDFSSGKLSSTFSTDTIMQNINVNLDSESSSWISKSIHESDKKYHALLEATDDAVLLMKGDRFIECNKSTLELFGCSLNQVINNHPYVLSPENQPDGSNSHDKAINKILSSLSGSPQEFEWIHRRKDGALFEARVKLKRIFLPTGTHIMAIVKDISEKKQLIREVHHRVKNNMQLITSIINLQQSYIQRKGLNETFDECRNRVMIISMVHELLYSSEKFSRIDFSDFLPSLISRLTSIHNIDENRISFNLNVKKVFMGIEQAVPCALLINELVTNAVLHAFPGEKSGQINIEFTRRDDRFRLEVKDNGVGMEREFSIPGADSLGFTLVRVLAGQLKGIVEYRDNEGSEFVISMEPSDIIE